MRSEKMFNQISQNISKMIKKVREKDGKHRNKDVVKLSQDLSERSSLVRRPIKLDAFEASTTASSRAGGRPGSVTPQRRGLELPLNPCGASSAGLEPSAAV